MKKILVILAALVLALVSCGEKEETMKKEEVMSFAELAQKRYSVRSYAPKPVEDDKIEAILEAGNMAPTAKNLQPQRIYVLKSKESLEKLAALTPMGFNAPVVLMIAYNEDEEWKNPLQEGIHSGIEDASIVASHIMFRATELGLGSCWVNYFANDELKKAFALPENEKIVLLMPIGYPAENSEPSSRHSEKKPLSETVKYL